MIAPSSATQAPGRPQRLSRSPSKVAPGTATGYRPDIDGLRAIAVTSVVLYHVGFEPFSGGFVGVDVFFVISGFLITNLLTAEFDRTGTIDLVRFYSRRARRLLPSLLATLTATAVVASVLLTPQRLMGYGASLLHAVVSFSNVRFFQESGYFDASAELKPLLHTWSLGVEEQFYFIWPFVVLGLSTSKALRPIGYAILFGGSWLLAERFIDSDPSAVFFLMPFRVFEFAIGALLVWLNTVRLRINQSLIFVVGAGLIAYSVVFYGPQTQFPGPAALLPCAGAALCILAGRDTALARPLRLTPLVGLGRLSYTLYLVHWPVIVFAKYEWQIDRLSLVQSALVIVTSVLFAVALHRLVEQPYRYREGRGILFGLVGLSVILMIIGGSMWATQGWPGRPFASDQAFSVEEIEQGRERRYDIRGAICESKGWERCNEPDERDVNGLIIGDSHAVDALNALHAVVPSHNFSLSEVGGCPPHREITELVSATHAELDQCVDANNTRHDPEVLGAYDYVVIAVRYGWYTPDHLREYLTFLDEVGVEKVIVVGGYLELNDDLPELINRGGFTESAIEPFVVPGGLAHEEGLRRLAADFGHMLMSKREVFCDRDTCSLFDEADRLFSYDSHHLSFEFATAMGTHHQDEITRFLATE